MGTMDLHPVNRRLIELEARIRESEERLEALELVIALLLRALPEGEGLRIVSSQANELARPETAQRYRATVELLDELRELLLQPRADGGPPR